MTPVLTALLLALLIAGTVAALAPAIRDGRPWSEMRAVAPLVVLGWVAFALLILL